VHRNLHTFVGAALVGLATAGVLLVVRRALRNRIDALAPTLRADGSTLGIAIGAMVGALSHPLDGFMHPDIEPFQPWTAENPLRGLITVDALLRGCLLSGLAGAILVGVWLTRERRIT
jgi:hypothetical protein